MSGNDSLTGNEIAIVGMACHLPGAGGPGEFWKNLQDGVLAACELSRQTLLERGVSEALIDHPDYVRQAVELEDFDGFDGAFFGLSARDSAMMDPQHRHFLEVCWEALENAGVVPARFDGDIGVYGGSGHNAYMPFNLLTNPELAKTSDLFELRHTSNDKDFLTTRVSYSLNLRGPSVNVQTACSTSLVAVHMAAQALLAGECDVAIAGGVTIEHPHGRGYLYREGEVLAADGVCRAFDEKSGGTIFGSGAGAVVLKPLDKAQEDGDQIHAVILASAVNNDGSEKAGYMAPSVGGQAAVVEEALEVAGVDADTVTYIETHGTGTAIGDPIELAALNQVYRPRTAQREYCALGSVKPNIGHLDTAAGVASLIKVVMALKNRQIPGLKNHTAPNPACDFNDSPFYLPQSFTDWQPQCGVRRAGVSSLGVGGTNAHLLLEEPPATDEVVESPTRRHFFPLSARTRDELSLMKSRMAQYLNHSAEPVLLNHLATTLQHKRESFAYRWCAGAGDMAQLTSRLSQPEGTGQSLNEPRKVIFAFPGGGSQRTGMGLELYQNNPGYRKDADQCLALMPESIAEPLRAALFDGDESRDLLQPSLSLPAIFLTQYCLGRLWMARNVQPTALIGHSLGDYAAACLAGVFQLSDAVKLVVLRGQLLEKIAEKSAMTSVNATFDQLTVMTDLGEVSIAAVNAPEMCLLSGAEAYIEHAEKTLEAKDISCRRLPLNAASHCDLLDPILPEFRALLASLTITAPSLPLVDNLTGDWLTADDALDPEHWVKHFRQTVYFSRGLSFLHQQEPDFLFLELSSNDVLSSFLRQHAFGPSHPAVGSLPKKPEDGELEQVDRVTSALWSNGALLDWDQVDPAGPTRTVSTPAYPFTRLRHWFDGGESVFDEAAGLAPLDGENTQASFGLPQWLRYAPPVDQEVLKAARWIVVGKHPSLTALQQRHSEMGGQFSELPEVDAADFGSKLISCLRAAEGSALVLMALTQTDPQDCLEALLTAGQAIASADLEQRVVLAVLTGRAQQVTAGESVEALAASVCDGALRVIASETGNTTVVSIDGALPLLPWQKAGAMLEGALSGALSSQRPWWTLALRGNQLFQRSFASRALDSEDDSPTQVKHDGVYVVIGANGTIGQALCEHLLLKYQAKLAALVRPGTDPQVLRSIAPEAGGQLQLFELDLLDPTAMGETLNQVGQRLGTIDGVFQLAGSLNADLLGAKTSESLKGVIAPKVALNNALCQALENHHPDFVMAFSSISAMAGIPGQFDYAGANGFVDALARSQQFEGQPWMAVGWGPWQHAGWMSLKSGHRSRLQGSVFDYRGQTEQGVTFWKDMSADLSWELTDHRNAKGTGIMPGTGYVGLALAAWQSMSGTFLPVQITDIAFAQTFSLAPGQRSEICVEILHGTPMEFVISSANGAIEHARGQMSPIETPAPADTFTPDLQGAEQLVLPEHPFVRFGPRWQAEKTVVQYQGNRVLSASLNAQCVGDLHHYNFHPALHDLAVGVAQSVAESNTASEMLVPFSYRNLILYSPIPGHVVVDCELLENTADFVTLAMRFFTPQGQLLASVGELSMRRIVPSLFETIDSSLPGLDSNESLTLAEGIDAIEALLSAPFEANVVVSKVPVEQVLAAARKSALPVDSEGGGEDDNRPELSTELKLPDTETEHTLAEIWSTSLGVRPVGVTDDFFELGGNSLLLARCATRAQKALGKSVAIRDLFDDPSVGRWASLFSSDEVGGEVQSLPVIARDQDHYVPSHSQRALWVIHRMYPEALAYQLTFGFRVTGEFSVPLMTQAVHELVDNHESLRAVFTDSGGELAMRLRAQCDDALEVIECPQENLQSALDASIRRPMSLVEGPLFRVEVYPSTNAWVVLLKFHHIIADQLSIFLVSDQLQTIYRSLYEEKPLPVFDAPLDYLDFAHWQAEEKTAEKLAGQLSFWADHIPEGRGCINLPTDHPRPEDQSFSGQMLHVPMGEELTARVREFARQKRTSVFNVLLSVFGLLLRRYTGENMNVVGVPFANRNDDENLAQVVGMFMNTLPVPMNVPDQQSFADLLAHVSLMTREVQSRQDTPLESIIELLKPVRDPSYNPLFQVGFAVQAPDPDLSFPGAEVETLRLHNGSSMYDMHLFCWDDTENAINFQLWYDDALFEAKTMQALVDRLNHLTNLCISNADLPLAEHSLATTDDLAQIDGWNAATQMPLEHPHALSLMAFREGVVRCEGQTVAVADLKRNAALIAGQLVSAGVEQGALVGIFMDRQINMLAAMLGTWMAGAGYIPMDPRYPARWRDYVISDSGLKAILVDEENADTLDEDELQLHCVEDILSAGDPSSPVPTINGSGEDSAYVIYTSGSTGQPKGVKVPQSCVANFLSAMSQRPGMTAEDHLVAVTTTSFDISVLELYLPLVVGADLTIAVAEEAADPNQLMELLDRTGATVMQATPTTWRLLHEAGWAAPEGFRVLTGGEALQQDLADALLLKTPQVWNMYGPTETTVWSTCTQLRAGTQVDIGTPIANTAIHVLDASGQRLPVGVAGDLCIAGNGVTDGYLGKPDLTQEVFLDNPFGEGKLYRTGDVARWLDSGALEYFGRSDFQVKIRGHRIELGQIENTMMEMAGLKQVIVNPVSLGEDDLRLVAYYVAEEGPLQATAFRRHLRKAVPDYMVPNTFLHLDSFPLTDNGKIDRKNLPTPNSLVQAASSADQEPQTDIQKQIAQIWIDMLKVPSVGLNDNFFEAGGHSLLAVNVVSEIEKVLGQRVSLRSIVLKSLAEVARECGDGEVVD